MTTAQPREQIVLNRTPVAAGERANPLSERDMAFLNKRLGEIGTAISQGTERAAEALGMRDTMARLGGQLQDIVGPQTAALAGAAKKSGAIEL